MSISESDDRAAFENWIIKEGKEYDDDEEKERRFKSFQHNLLVEDHFSDLTLEEWRERYSHPIPETDSEDEGDYKMMTFWSVQKQIQNEMTMTVSVSVSCPSLFAWFKRWRRPRVPMRGVERFMLMSPKP